MGEQASQEREREEDLGKRGIVLLKRYSSKEVNLGKTRKLRHMIRSGLDSSMI